MNKRNRTDLRYIDRKTGKVTRVTEYNGMYFIGDTNNRAEGKMTHYNGVKHLNQNKKHKDIGDEWSDYAYTSNDL